VVSIEAEEHVESLREQPFSGLTRAFATPAQAATHAETERVDVG
jgi:hypothetical protein